MTDGSKRGGQDFYDLIAVLLLLHIRASFRASVFDYVCVRVSVAPCCLRAPVSCQAEADSEQDNDCDDCATSFAHNSLLYMLPRVSISVRAAGPSIAMKRTGNRKHASGKSNLTAAFCAACSARCRRLVRSESEKTRTARAMDVPNRSA